MNHELRTIRFSHMITFLLMIIFMMSSIIVYAHPIDKEDYVVITVKSGDNLWNIATHYKEKANMSTNEMIKWIENNNELYRESISPGQKLVIPVKLNKMKQSE